MQSVSVDLRNPSEVAHLVSRIRQLPRIVLNNFQLLDNATKRNLLFDMLFLTERPNIRFAIVGTWPNEEYLEEIEPGIAGKFRYVLVPTWSDSELRGAAAQWSAQANRPAALSAHLDECVALAAGDISLFHALIESPRDQDDVAPPSAGLSAAQSAAQAIVMDRFRRGLGTKLKAILAQREAYVTYSCIQTTSRIVRNPRFSPIPNAALGDYLRTSINPSTDRPYSDGREVLLDADSNPQYVEETTNEVVTAKVEIASFLLRRLHAAASQGSHKLDLAAVAREFGEQLLPVPFSLDEAKLQAAFETIGEVQRRALVAPPMLGLDGTGSAIEIVDRRLALYLESVSLDELGELIEDARPRSTPRARRRSHVSPELTEAEKAQHTGSAPEGAPAHAGGEEPEERDAGDEDGADEEEPARGETADADDAEGPEPAEADGDDQDDSDDEEEPVDGEVGTIGPSG